MSYHDVVVFVDGQEYRIADDYSLQLTCTRTGGWELWLMGQGIQVAGEYSGHAFRIEVAGIVICDKAASHDVQEGDGEGQ